MTTDHREAKLTDLRAKLKAREGRDGYAENCEEIRAYIARLEGEKA